MDFEELNNRIDSLQNDIKNLQFQISQTSGKRILDNYLDEDSKRILEQVIRRFYAKTAETVGAGFIITPKSQYHRLTGTAARTSDTTTAVNDGSFVGQLLIIEGTNDVSTITIKDNANTKMAGDAVLGVNDTLTLMWNDTDWVEIARANT